MNDIDSIEFVLGKCRFPNKDWKEIIPPSWDIPARIDTRGRHTEAIKNSIQYDNLNNTEYEFNNLGYRSNFNFHLEELKNKKIILFIGCSDTFGKVVEYNKIFPSIIAELLPEYVILNMGILGASADCAVRIGTQTILALKGNIEHVIMVWPSPSNREFVSKKFKSGIVALNRKNVPYSDWWDHIDWVNNNYNYNKNRNLISSVSIANNAKFHDLIIDRECPEIKKDLIQYYPYTSLGENTHQAIANYFYRKIMNKYSLYDEMRA